MRAIITTTKWRDDFASWRRLSAVMLLGFSSGLPIALTISALQAWMTVEGLDLATIGFLGLIGLPYTFKFIWAPLLDRFELPFFGRRLGWIFILQLLIALLLFSISFVSPSQNLTRFGFLAFCIAFCSASLDIIVDAYRTDVLSSNERGLGVSLSVLGYRIAMIVSGGIAMIWAQQWNSWPQVYEVMSLTLCFCAVVLFFYLPKLSVEFRPLNSNPKSELLGFFVLVVAGLVTHFVLQALFEFVGIDLHSKNNWLRVTVLILDVFPSLAIGVFFARKIGFETLNASLESFFKTPYAWAFLWLMFLYKVGDAFTVSLTTPFMIRGLGFTQIDVGLANKTLGLVAIILGSVVGGFAMLRMRLWTAMFSFGVLQVISIFGFYYLSVVGKGAWGTVDLPAFDIFIAKIVEPTPIDRLMVSVVAFENFASGLGTAAHIALIMSLCHKQFSATHFALMSAFATLGRTFVAPFSGVVASEWGWPEYYLIAVVVASPGVLLLWYLRKPIEKLA